MFGNDFVLNHKSQNPKTLKQTIQNLWKIIKHIS